MIFYDFENRHLMFPAQNLVKSGQNLLKFKKSGNLEKIQFFHVPITFVVQELVVPSQIENKVHFWKMKKWQFFRDFFEKGPELISKVPWC